MSEGGVGLAAVLAEHRQDAYAEEPCSCCSGSTVEYQEDCGCGFVAGPGQTYAAHLADVVLDHLAAKASEAAVVEAVAESVRDGWYPANRYKWATGHVVAALAAFLGTLREATDGPEKPRTAPESDRGGLSDHLDALDDEETASE